MPNAENCTLSELETAMKAARSARSHVRMLAIRALLLGQPFETVRIFVGKSEKTVSRWIDRFNRRGIDGLVDRPRSGRPRKISPIQSAAYRAFIEKPERVGRTHWTGRKFHGFLRDELSHEVGYSTVLRWLHENDYRLKVPQPWPNRQDESERQAFVERLKHYLQDERIELWYLDEMGVEGDPRPRRRWAVKGEKTRVTRNGDHLRMNVTGMICPRTGAFYALEFSHSDSVTFQTFLDQADQDVSRQRPRNLLICDNASWHKNRSIDWGAFEPVFLPAYSPDLNPIERLWLLVKAEWFTDFIAKDRDALMERLDAALRWITNRQDENRSTCRIKTVL